MAFVTSELLVSRWELNIWFNILVLIFCLPLVSHSLRKYRLTSKRLSKKKSPVWITACEKTWRRSCDLTKFSLYYLGIYVLRVQANVNGDVSAWEQKEFCPDTDGKSQGDSEWRENISPLNVRACI